MAEFMLHPLSPLGGIESRYRELDFAEVSDQDIVSIATPLGEQQSLFEAVMGAHHIELPSVGRWQRSPVDNTYFLGTAPNQYFIMSDHSKFSAENKITNTLGEAIYVTDQSDSWVVIKIGGPKSRAALERVCAIDLHPDFFPAGNVARTLLDHIGTIIIAEGNDQFLLLSARSSANSFCQTLQRSIENVL